MKTNLFRRFKWYIVGFIMIVAMLSVGLSFCTWDDLSIQALNARANTGDYTELMYNLGAQSGDDKGTIGIVDVGDIVTFGRYWQDEGATGVEKLKPQRWIVVNIDENKAATLLAEKVVVFGNFWGNGIGDTVSNHNYYQSTLRAWLNSGRDSVSVEGTIGNVATKASDENWRDDGVGSQFSGVAEKQANKGFLDVAFNAAEQSILIAKPISGMEGREKDTNAANHTFKTRGTNKTEINDLVWVPSWHEIYGNTNFGSNPVLDDQKDEQFQYFITNTAALKVASATDYAWNSYDTIASYYNNGKGGRDGTQAATWWWLRSPYSLDYKNVLMVYYTNGNGRNAFTHHAHGGVRPAVCVQL